MLGGLYALLALVVSFELFRLVGRWPQSLASRVVLAGGKALQRYLTTREPAREHLEPACVALRRVVELEGRRSRTASADMTSPGMRADWASLRRAGWQAMTRAILLIDMDAFYASVEQARRPELVGRPVIVGGAAESRGVVSTASYEARACGVRTAMPTAQAQRLCPQAAFLRVDMQAYKAVQAKLLEIFGRFTDLVEPVSIDEAFLDVTGSRRLFGSPQEIARQIQGLVRDELGLSCSIGIGPTRLLAKLAAELRKPGGLTTLTKEDVHGRLRELPVGELSGIGPVTEERLRARASPPSAVCRTRPPRSSQRLSQRLGGAQGARLRRLRRGRARRTCAAQVGGPRGDLRLRHRDPELLQATLLDLADRAAGDLRRKGYACRTLTLKLRDSGFTPSADSAPCRPRRAPPRSSTRPPGAALRAAPTRLSAAPARSHPQRPHR